MKNFLTLLMTVFFASVFSQEYKEFYVVQKIGKSIEPTTKSLNANNELNLTFNKQELQNFFQTKKIYIYEKAFPESQNDTLKNTYFLKTNTNITKSDLEGLSDVLLVGELDLAPVEELYEPNDYFFEMETVKNESILDLVRVPLAWEITQGSSSVLIGIREQYLHPYHPELINKVEHHDGDDSIGTSHGTSVASIAAGATNNGNGFASIGNGVSNNYVLNTSSTQTTINLNNYQSGHYIFTLVCDGQIVDSKNLIKN